MTVGAQHEHDLIAWIRRRVPPPSSDVVLGIGDDAAVLRAPRGESLVQTTDTLVEGVHFDRRLSPPEAIGRRAVAVNLSDLAAMAARPQWLLLSLVLPPDLPLTHFEALIDGAIGEAAAHGAHLVGGNLTRTSGPLVISVTATGRVRPRRVLRRDTARAGDSLWITGSVGDAAAGLAQLQADASASGVCVERYRRPTARVREALALAGARVASAAMDVSDGLADAVQQVAAASGVGARVEASLLPISAEARAVFTRLAVPAVDTTLRASDDYELLISVPPRAEGRLRAVRGRTATPFTRIGVLTKDTACVVLTDGVAAPLSGGFTHFAHSG